MYYYQTYVRDSSYKSNEPLTYASESRLESGKIVKVPLKKTSVLGLIMTPTTRPRFQTKSFEKIFDLPPLSTTPIKLIGWLLDYYPSSVGVVMQQFLPGKLPDKLPPKGETLLSQKADLSGLPTLTGEQKYVLSKIKAPGTYVLHGETGSGKTRVYVELTAETLRSGRSAIILTPEIGLTPQLALNFKQIFGETRVVVIHSKLTDRQRTESWLRVLCAQSPLVVIGPRSALFAPLSDIGLIVVDEFHEPSYAQDQLPHYHATKVAAALVSLHKAKLVLGSATPTIVDYFLATEKQRPILRMQRLAQKSDFKPPNIRLIDLKNRSNFSRSRHLADKLLQSIERSLSDGEQSLLFLNRRGTARTVLCEGCGWQALCPHCNLPFTYHGDEHVLRCHTCGKAQPAVVTCPICEHETVVLKNIGTKAIVNEVSSFFPHAIVKRFDADNKRSERLEHQYHEILAGNVDIIVGTQILAKGLDLPNLSTVGIINADTNLAFPDYTSQERTYQLLRQVIGRVGRGHRKSSVLIQTYEPRNEILQTVVENNWTEFYERELRQRQKFGLPPYYFLLKLSIRRANPRSCEHASEKLLDTLRKSELRLRIEGPSPAFHEKVGKTYEWQIVLKARDRRELIKVISLLPSGWTYYVDPLHLL